MATLEELAKARNVARDKVVAWMNTEGAQGNLRTNDQSPYWAEYVAAETAFCEAAALPRS